MLKWGSACLRWGSTYLFASLDSTCLRNHHLGDDHPHCDRNFDVDLAETGVLVRQSHVGKHRPPLRLVQIAAREVNGSNTQHPTVRLLEVDQRVVAFHRPDDVHVFAVVGDVFHAVDEHQVDEEAERRRNLFDRFLVERDRLISHSTQRVQNEVSQRAEVQG